MLPGSDGIGLMERAEDYIVKAFSLTKLVERIQAALRRRTATEWADPSESYVLGELTVVAVAVKRKCKRGHTCTVREAPYPLEWTAPSVSWPQ